MTHRILFLSLFCILFSSVRGQKSWSYSLQNISISSLQKAKGEYAVIDYSADGSDSLKWSKTDVDTISSDKKKVLAYLSIGEAEDYRWYWKKEWEKQAPNWLARENNNWQGNYKVKFWDPAWKSIVFEYIDTILKQGFDGVYLDIIDGYEYWNEKGVPSNRGMMQFVQEISDYTKGKNANFLVVPQNGEGICFAEGISEVERQNYFSAIDGIGVEDVFFQGKKDENNKFNADLERIFNIKKYKQQGKFVLSVEYLTKADKIQQHKKMCTEQGYYHLSCTRDLKGLCGQ